MALPVIHLDRAQQAAFTGWAGEVSIYADLPVATAVAGEFWMVLNPTGSRFLLNYKAAGLYLSEAGVWRKINDAQILLNDNQFSVYNAVDNTKQIAFDASVIATATKRTATWPDKDGTVAMLSDITGGGVFTPTINSTNMVEVSQESDFGVAVGSVITLTTNTTYFIRGNVNCTNRILIDTEGIAIVGWDRDKDSLTYTSTGGDFITVTDVNFELSNIKLSSTNATGGEVVLRAVNYDALEYNNGRLKILTIINCQFRDCFDVVYIEGFDLVDIQQTLFWYIKSTVIGCQFKSTSKLQISSCEFVRWFDESTIPTPSGYATTPMIEFLVGSMGATNITGCILHPQQTQYGLKISPTSTTGFGTISGNTFINIGLTTGAVSDFDYSVQNAYIIQANQGLLNGNAKGTLQVTGNNIAFDMPIVVSSNLAVLKPANLIGGAFTNTPTFPTDTRVLTSVPGNGLNDNDEGTSFTYNNKNDGNFFVVVTATVEYNNTGPGTKDGFIQCVLRAGDGVTQTEITSSIGVTEVKGFANSLSFSVIGQATLGSVFDVVFKTFDKNGVAPANEVTSRELVVREFVLNGYQF